MDPKFVEDEWPDIEDDPDFYDDWDDDDYWEDYWSDYYERTY